MFGNYSLDVALLLLRATAGIFFAISGYHKLFNKERHQSLVNTLTKDGIPLVKLNQWWVPGVEFVAGIALVLGLYTEWAALFLLGICLVACLRDGIPKIPSKFHPIDRADWLDDVLYLPETVYFVLLLALILTGGGRFSLGGMTL